MDPKLNLDPLLAYMMPLGAVAFLAGFLFLLFKAYRDFGTSQKRILIYVCNDREDKHIPAYVLNGEIYTRRYFFKLDPSSKLLFNYDSFPLKAERKTPFGVVPVIRAMRTIEGELVPADADFSTIGKNYRLIDASSKGFKSAYLAEMRFFTELTSRFINAPNSLAEAIIMGVKENWIGVATFFLFVGFVVITITTLQYNGTLVAVSEKMKEVSEILAEVAKQKLNSTNVTDSNVIVDIGVR